MSGTYYSENDSKKAAVLRELIRAGAIAAGEVDERGIEHVEPADLVGFTQCHFFAGIGAWSYALRSAGWPDDREVWTGSCPCQPYSRIGKQAGARDPRHLWPEWYRLIRERKPATVFGEQVERAIRWGWLDAVQSELEGSGYSVGKAVLGACSVGGPTIRQRLYFAAGLVHSIGSGLEGYAGDGDEGDESGWLEEGQERPASETGTVSGFWSGAEWIPCRRPDVPGAIEWRPIERGTFPLAHGTAHRVFGLHCYGDAIVPEVAEAFIRSYVAATEEV